MHGRREGGDLAHGAIAKKFLMTLSQCRRGDGNRKGMALEAIKCSMVIGLEL
jgi:hypothetical protein